MDFGVFAEYFFPPFVYDKTRSELRDFFENVLTQVQIGASRLQHILVKLN